MLLTFFDMSARTHYLNARQHAAQAARLAVVPVINENDTTTTDEISFGDNDFLAAQVAILLGADAARAADRHRRPATPPTRACDPGARLVDEVDDFEALDELEIGAPRSPLGSGGMRSKVVAAEMATAAGIPTVIASGLDARRARRGAWAGEPVGHALRAAASALVVLQAVAQVRQADARRA